MVAQTQQEAAIFDIAWLSCVGTATLLAGLVSGPILGMPLGATFRLFLRTLARMRYSIAAILAMLGLGFVTRYSGMDAVMGLAMANTGVPVPLFGDADRVAGRRANRHRRRLQRAVRQFAGDHRQQPEPVRQC